jgi:hypothetical protein
MSLETVRQSIISAIETAKVGCPNGVPIIEYDNRIIVNTQTQSVPFLCVQIKLLDGVQADLNVNPIHRIYGQIHISAAVKEGDGSALAYTMLSHFYPQLQKKQLGDVRTAMYTFAPTRPHLGWVYYPILIPFWSDTIY